jgi:hypothetical protein
MIYECSFWAAADYEMARQNVPIYLLFNNTNTNRGGCQHYLRKQVLMGRVFDTHQQRKAYYRPVDAGQKQEVVGRYFGW